MISFIFSINCLIFLGLISIFYFSKERLKNIENQIYSALLITNILGLVIDIFGYFMLQATSATSSINVFISHLYLLYYFTWGFILTLYVYSISFQQNEDNTLKNRNIFFGFYLIIAAFVLVLPITINTNGSAAYSSGIGVNLVYMISGLFIVFDCFCIIKHLKKILLKKYSPILIFLLVSGITMTIQKYNPQITLLLVSHSIVTFLMYFTIENPDIKMIQKLEVAKDLAENANKAKTDFLSSMSHEIRTPLNAIVGFSDCITDSETLDEAKENAHDIINASSTLLEIVNGILDISKIEAGKVDIVNAPYKPKDTFENLAKLITPRMNEKGLDFTYKIAPDLPQTLNGDQANIKKVITNLLSNACKYTKAGFVHYEVNCVKADNACRLIITVEDSGQGIKKDDIDKLFNKFQRLDEDKNATIEGTGLGLAITKQLVELMGGKIIVHTIYGEGSKFTVVLNQEISNVVIREEEVDEKLDLKDVKILVVDDAPLNLKVSKKLFAKFKANMVDTCESGFECIEKIKSGKEYDVILLDDLMPKMNGVKTLEKLKEIEGFKIPVVCLTANAITGMKEKYLDDGFDDYLAKPIEKDQLAKVINKILKRKAEGSHEKPILKEENGVTYETYKFNSKKGEKNMLEENQVPENNVVEPVTEVPVTEAPIVEETPAVEEAAPAAEPEVVSTEAEPVVETPAPVKAPSAEGGAYDRAYLESNGVDVNHALELLGDMEMYNMTIADFMSEVEAKWGRINDYKAKNDMPNYAIEVHSLKSDCKYLGFMTLADIAYQHELKSKENDSAFVNEHFAELEEEYNKVFEIAKAYADHNPVAE